MVGIITRIPLFLNAKITNMKSLVPALLLVLLTASSCNYFGGKYVRGDGNVVTRERSVSDFSGVDVSGAIDVVVTQDSAYSVRVETDNNLQDLVEIYNSNGVLQIHSRNNFNLDPSRKTIVHVAAPAIRGFYVSGASSIRSTNKMNATGPVEIDITGASDINLDINSPEVRVDMSGASKAIMKGETRDLSIEGSGASHVKAYDLLSENADIRISGASSAEIYASVKLEADASGASHIKYRGKAAVNSNSSGASHIDRSE